MLAIFATAAGLLALLFAGGAGGALSKDDYIPGMINFSIALVLMISALVLVRW